MSEQNVKAQSTPYFILLRFWRSSPKNKKKLENWVEEKTKLGSVPVFLRAGDSELHPKAISDLKIPNSW